MSAVVKRSVSIRGHRTSFSVEQPFFDELTTLAARRGMSVAALVASIDEGRGQTNNLSSAIRLFVLDAVRKRLD